MILIKIYFTYVNFHFGTFVIIPLHISILFYIIYLTVDVDNAMFDRVIEI